MMRFFVILIGLGLRIGRFLVGPQELRNGAKPSFIVKAVVLGSRFCDIVHCPKYDRLIMISIMRSMDAVACVGKYFVDASIAAGLNFFYVNRNNS